jgi:hypothetical protein
MRHYFSAATKVILLATTLAACSASNKSESTPLPSVSPAQAASRTAADSDVAPIPQPALHSGDVWVDRIDGADREFRIESIHDGKMEVDFWGAEMTTDSVFNVIVYRSLTMSSSEPTISDKPGMWFSFPLYPGKTWDNHYNWETTGAAPVKGKADDHGKVLGWEDVQVPAGTFHALKVEVDSRFYGKGGMADDETLIFWYSPQVNRFVKFDYRSIYEGELLAEMVSYKPSGPPP